MTSIIKVSRHHSPHSLRNSKYLLVYKLFQPLLPFLDEIVIKYSIVSSKRKLPQKRFPREWGNYNLKQHQQSEFLMTTQEMLSKGVRWQACPPELIYLRTQCGIHVPTHIYLGGWMNMDRDTDRHTHTE